MSAFTAAQRLQSFANEDPEGGHKLHRAGAALQASDPTNAALYHDLANVANTQLTAPEALLSLTRAHHLSDGAADALISSLLTTAKGDQA